MSDIIMGTQSVWAEAEVLQVGRRSTAGKAV